MLVALGSLVAGLTPSRSEDIPTAPSFVDDFTSFDRARWYIADGWANGKYQNCIWSKKQVKLSNGMLTLGFEKQKVKDRDFACGEVQSKQRFGYGTYE
ncbi:MAG: glycosyl hydrolase family protein, partial [Mesorhizobium sp.]